MAKQPAPAATSTTATRTYEAAKLTAISAAVPIPANAGKSNRGARSLYPFDDLDIGQSFGIQNKTAKQMASTVSGANKRHMVDAKDAEGNIIFKTQTVKQPDGTEVKVATLEPEKVAGRTFVVMDVDPASDPDKAVARVWRTA